MIDSPAAPVKIVFGEALHEEVVVGALLNARCRVWVATADLKDMHVRLARGYRPILEVFDRLAENGVQFRIIHSNLPSRPFRDTLEALPRLAQGALELQICPRSHWKMVLVDGRFAYFGSANFTGAGLGVKKPTRRNLEVGAITTDQAAIKQLESRFDKFWMGEDCRPCAHRKNCPDPIP